ncbi:Rieske 2Fe-2S domain-containing protein [Limibaculum sp. M0105]|uniref:Rieske 2Fe-2S domain-containing protein n=1 Tax=Thermohalobaculum xanthum TaxID=2753746 RepID=A0A8J7M5E3_9RHOB|nr:SRPBCC family protein [Thermohalobaculum xanthum]MBK0398764.1 Rieske 2Fe-2S domain-containing protein [Thermohalobaculum xanthum]
MNVHDPSAAPSTDPAAELAATTARPFGEAMSMPKGVYTSDAFLARELEHVFRRDWICVGRASALARPGDYLTYDLAGEPVMVVRDADGRLRAQSNVCRHRMSVLLEGRGNVARITCPYHGWVYNLDGHLRGAPYMAGNTAFRRDEICLPQIRCEEWLGWVMVTLDPDAPPVAERLAGLAAELEPFGMEHYIEDFQETFVWDTNWKILAENFMESYHLPVCHAATIGGLSDIEASALPPGAPAYNIHTIQKDPSFTLSVAHPTNTRLKGEWRLRTAIMAIYPSLLITLSPGYFWYLSLHPRGVGKVHVTFGGGLAPEFMADPASAEHFKELRKLLEHVNDEDKGCTERVYRGVSATLSAPGPLSPMERPLYDFARYLAERVA